MDTLQGYLAFVVVLVAMIVIHEFGHFIVAKMLGIAVETFSVGFGPRLLGFRYGETDYRISAIPLGGYVKFRGENMELIQGKSEGSVDEFLSHPKWKRLLVAAAGPLFNIATAILIPTVAILIGYQEDIYNSQPVVIGEVAPGSTAEKAGLRAGDRILAVRDVQNPVWEDFKDEVRVHPYEDIPLKVERNGQVLTLAVRPEIEEQGGEKFGDIDIDLRTDHIGVSSVSPGSPAAKAGIQVGDKIVAINDASVISRNQFRRIVSESKGQEVTLRIQRGQQTFETRAAPEKKGDAYLLGIGIKITALAKRNSLASALAYGWKYNWRIIRLTGVIFKQVFAGQRSARNTLSGPIGIAEQTADTFRLAGWAGVIWLMGLLSLNLGIVNLLPIPVLDGGVILLIIIEALMGLVGLTMTMNMRERFQQVGFVMVLLLMAFVIGNDIVRKISKPAAETPPATQPAK
ncbi:MAG TPA: site-2 protease family protein [Blastocatellia bacterium]|nr:site-2 protease family protein [Blastocatellia bacterium]